MDHKPSVHWIQMHVIQLLRDLLSAPDVEIVEASLPEVFLRARIAVSMFWEQVPEDLLLQHLKRLRRIASARFRDEEVYVLRHHDVSDQREGVPGTNFVEHLHEAIAAVWHSKERAPGETTEGDEVKIAISITALKWIAHGQKPAPLKPTRVRHPTPQPPEVIT
jgi:uncharacterized protein (DUF2267 family)